MYDDLPGLSKIVIFIARLNNQRVVPIKGLGVRTSWFVQPVFLGTIGTASYHLPDPI